MIKKIIILSIILSFSYGQSIKDVFTKTQNQDNNKPTMITGGVIGDEALPYTPIEKPIDPDSYILGPGDLLGINVVAVENISAHLRVNPIGEILIPSVGVLKVAGLSLSSAKTKIQNYISLNSQKNAIIDVTLMDIRRFKVQIAGAVLEPGFYPVNPANRLYDIILRAGGVQKFAHPEIVYLERKGKKQEIRLKEFLVNGNILENPTLLEGDVVFIPFSKTTQTAGHDLGGYNNHQVIVYGFVNKVGASTTYKFFPGYTARDYIAMAGGTKEIGSSFRSGNIRKTIIYRSGGEKIKNALDKAVLPGDMIEVPPNLFYQIVGGDGIMRTLSTIASIVSSYYIFDSIVNK